MKRFVLLCHALGGTAIDDTSAGAVGNYLKSFDVEAHDGRGSAIFTPNAAEALTFDSTAAAMECWRTQSKTRPLREDGKPNRPLTAFTVSIEQIDQFDLFFCAAFEHGALEHCATVDFQQCERCRIMEWQHAEKV